MSWLSAEILLAIVTLLGCLGGGMKYVLDRTAARQKELETAQAARQKALEDKQEIERTRIEAERIRHELKIEQERLRWEQLMSDQLMELRREIRLQEHEVSYLRDVSTTYLRHISALEGLMRAAGIEIPELKLPVYRPLVEDGNDTSEIEGELAKKPRRRRGAC